MFNDDLKVDRLTAFGKCLVELRKAKGWSQERLALESGVARSYLSSVERGKLNVSLINICRLAETLQLSLEEMFRQYPMNNKQDEEDKADLRDYLIAKDSSDEFIPYEVVKRLTIDNENPIKVWREYRRLTQTELAQKANTTQATISKFENGQDGTVSVLKRIASALAVNLDDLV